MHMDGLCAIVLGLWQSTGLLTGGAWQGWESVSAQNQNTDLERHTS